VHRLAKQLWVAFTSLTLVASGCAPRQPFYFFEDGDLSHYVGAIQKLEYPDSDQPPLDEAAGTAEPLTLSNPSFDNIWEVSLEEAATACNLSPSYFSRQFKQVFSVPFNDYARGFRLRLAARRIISGGERISDIAYELGFGTHAHFAAAFSKRYGMSPRDYRASGRPK
jgi:AraC-like DNA-binding protein